MKSYGVKMGLFAAVVAVCVFFGIDIATSGMERIRGPIPGASVPAPTAASVQAPSLPAVEVKLPEPTPAPAKTALPATAGYKGEPSFINRAFLKIGDALRYAAQGTIRFIVSVFSAVIH
jgi:hypothetical protein